MRIICTNHQSNYKGNSFDLRQDVISVPKFKTKEEMDFVFNMQVYQLGCDTMPNVKFWKMDSGI